MKTSKQKLPLDSIDYASLLKDIKSILEVEKIWGERVSNQIKLQITWKIGERISQELQAQAQREAHLMPIYESLSKDLHLAVNYLSATVKFFRLYTCPQYLSPELTWSHYYRRKFTTHWKAWRKKSLPLNINSICPANSRFYRLCVALPAPILPA